MPIDALKVAAEAMKLVPRYAAPLGVCLGVVLLSPANWLQRIGIGQLAEDHRQALGLLFVLCWCLVLAALLNRVRLWIQAQAWERRHNLKVMERLASLNEDEKQILRFYLQFQTRTNRLRIDDGVVQGLVASGVLYRSASMGNILEGFDHNLTEAAWQVLNNDPALLEGSTDVYRTDKNRRGW